MRGQWKWRKERRREEGSVFVPIAGGVWMGGGNGVCMLGGGGGGWM